MTKSVHRLAARSKKKGWQQGKKKKVPIVDEVGPQVGGKVEQELEGKDYCKELFEIAAHPLQCVAHILKSQWRSTFTI